MRKSRSSGNPNVKSLSIDTSVLIAAERGDQSALEILSGVSVFVCSVVVAEWWVGVHALRGDDAKKAKLMRFHQEIIRHIPVHPFTVDDAPTFGQSVGTMQTKGKKLGFPDAAIGSQALRYGVPMATYNAADFRMIPGLEVWDPNEKAPAGDGEGHEG